MTPGFRKFSLILLAGFVLMALGCRSYNKGKIEGRWSLVSAEGVNPEKLKRFTLVLEFGPKGTLTVGPASSDKAVQELIDKGGQNVTMSCKYKLLLDYDVEFYDLPQEMQEKGGLFGAKDRVRVKIKITGDTMTMTDPEAKTSSFARVK